MGNRREALLRVRLPGPDDRNEPEKISAYVTFKGDTALLIQELEEVEQKPRATVVRELVEEALEARLVQTQDSDDS